MEEACHTQSKTSPLEPLCGNAHKQLFALLSTPFFFLQKGDPLVTTWGGHFDHLATFLCYPFDVHNGKEGEAVSMVSGLPKHTIRISQETYKRVKYIASINDRSINAEMRIAIRNHIDAFEAEKGKIDPKKLPKD